MPLVDNMCWDCYKARNRLILVPEGLTMEFCDVCGSYRVHGSWVKSNRGGDALLNSAMDFVERYVKLNGVGVFSILKAKMIGYNRVSVLVHAHGSVNVKIPVYDEDLWVELSVKRVICPKCSRASSGSFSSVVQIRADGRRLDEREVKCVNELIEKILLRDFGEDSPNYKVEFVHGGFDYKVDSFRLARRIAEGIRRSMGAFVKESYKVIGFDGSKGSKISRLSISVRLPKFSLGDVLSFDGKILVYDGFRNGKFFFYDLISGVKYSINYRDGWSKKIDILCRWDELYEGFIESISNDVVGISHSSGKIYYASKPAWLNVKCGDNVRFAVINGKTFIVSRINAVD